MAYSSDEGKEFFKDWVKHMINEGCIHSSLDMGAGAGTYGKLIVECISWINQYRHFRNFDSIACEVYKPYIEKFNLGSIYDVVWEWDMEDAAKHIKFVDLAIMGDVIEHVEHDTAVNIINILKPKVKFIWISTPLKSDKFWVHGYNQGEEEYQENIHEKHLHYWTEDDLLELDPLFIVPFNTVAVCLLEGTNV